MSYQSEVWFETVEADVSKWDILWDHSPQKNGCPAVNHETPPVRGWVKPRRDEPDVAAKEKIAADLGFMLKLPVASVLLATVPTQEMPQKPVAISRYANAPDHRGWRYLKSKGTKPLLDQVGNWFTSHRYELAGIWVLDIWLRNGDRTDRNTMVAYEGDNLKCVYFFDFDMSQAWLSNHRRKTWQTMPHGQPCREIQTLVEPDDVVSWIDRIRALPRQEFADVIERIPDQYLSPPKKELHLAALAARRDRVEEAFESLLEEDVR